MKTVYCCEKCGKTFDNYEDAYACENNHAKLDHVYHATYSKGSAIPTEISVLFNTDSGIASRTYKIVNPEEAHNDHCEIFKNYESIRCRLRELEDAEMACLRKNCEDKGYTLSKKYYYYENMVSEYRQSVNSDYETPQNIKEMQDKFEEVTKKMNEICNI